VRHLEVFPSFPNLDQRANKLRLECSLVALLAVLGGAGAYYATMDDPKAAAARDARKLESGIKHEVNDFRQGARSSSAPLVDASSSRRELERAKDNVTPSKSWSDSLGLGGNSASDEASRLGSKAQNAAEDAKDTVKGWGRSLKHETENAWNGHGEGVKDEIVRWKKALSSPDGKMGVEQVEEYLRSKGHYTTTLEPYRLFDFFGTAPSLRKTQVETSLGRYEREVSLLCSRYPRLGTDCFSLRFSGRRIHQLCSQQGFFRVRASEGFNEECWSRC